MTDDEYFIYPGVDDQFNFPPLVRQRLAESPELLQQIGQAIVDKDPIMFAQAVAAATDNFLTTQKIPTMQPRTGGHLGDDDFTGFRTASRQRVAAWRLDKKGDFSLGAVRSMVRKGVLAVRSLGATLTTGSGVRFMGENGKQAWFDADSTGGPGRGARAAIINAVHLYAGPREPFVYPGNFVIWFKVSFSWKFLDLILLEGY